MFGDPTLVTPFTAFDDTVSTEYAMPGLCALAYSLSLAADATNYAVLVDSIAPSISVLTTNNALIGTSVTLTLTADSTTA